MRLILLLLTLLLGTNSFSQTIKFSYKDFPTEKFKITCDTTVVGDFKTVLIVVRPLLASVAQYQGTRIWMQRLSDGKVMEKYFGEMDTERGLYRPILQPLKDIYIIVECGEYLGQVNVITKSGNFITLPGYNYSLSEPGFIYTKQAGEKMPIYKYDLKHKIGTELSNKSTPKENIKFENIESTYWVK
jgi:hypothetical protein